jgi:hypothetical protein
VSTYLSVSRGLGVTEPSSAVGHRLGDGKIRYVDGALEHPDGRPADRVRAAAPLVLRLVVEATAPVVEPAFGFVVWMNGQMVYSTSSTLAGLPPRSFAPGERAQLRIPFTAALGNGAYLLSVAIGDATGREIHDWVTSFATLLVEGSSTLEGVAELSATFAYHPAPGQGTTRHPVAGGQR